ncbi:ABC-2 transporter permease [Faecalispora anaeroviscerum]|uniref:ABC-2 transporter permease n=1 Tax=Faecalispora anaeroviscerum TaxID=2991836 RepID=UPI0024BAF8A7|nr:ABC-2 transporter permease [Faecalispora anaeroviscerum]
MKGLLRKDFMLQKKDSLILWGVFTLLYLFSALFRSNASFLISVAQTTSVIMAVSLSMNIFSLDDACKWNIYALSLPVGRRLLVGARYVYLSLMTLALCVYSFLGVMLTVRSGWQEFFWAHLSFYSLSLVMIALICPTVYRFGTHDARILLVVLTLFFALLLIQIDLSPLTVPKFDLQGGVPLQGIFFAVSAAVLLLSYALSCRILERHDVR